MVCLQACERCLEASCVRCAGSSRSNAVIIGSVVGAAAALALLAGLVGLVFWVQRKRREESVRNLSDLGALPGTVSIPLMWMCARPHYCRICVDQLLVTLEFDCRYTAAVTVQRLL